MSKHVFISYVHENSDQVLNLSREIVQGGVDIWLNRNDISPGIRWRDAIRKAIKNGDFFIACFSKEYADKAKSYMNEELTLAIEELRQYPTNRAWFIPVKLSNCEIPDRNIGAGETLRDIQWVELYEDWEKGIKNILKVVSDIKKPYPKSGNEIILDTSRPMKERMQDVTEAWMNSGKRADLLVNGKSFFAAQCWSYDNRVYSPKHENYDEGMVDFIAASRSSIGGDKGWDAILREHTLCDMCRENYRFENIQICTGCMRYTCYKCADYYHKSCNDQVVG